VATLLGGIDADILQGAGLSEDDITSIKARVLDHSSYAVSSRQRVALGGRIRSGSEPAMRQASVPPAFVDALIRQPRAGATHPGKPRLILEPPENHGDHCLAVAVLGVLLSERYDADPGVVFLAGLAHHLHNATLPDAGFAGEMLLGDHLTAILRRLVENALATLQSDVADVTRRALAVTADASTPEGRAFNAADVIDRVMEVRHFAQVASFTESHSLNDMQVVHEGPLQAFHYDVIQRAGLNVA
jgi:5'-deoxynucleotidase YfbR-like HD superfamily hydrolase